MTSKFIIKLRNEVVMKKIILQMKHWQHLCFGMYANINYFCRRFNINQQVR